MDMEPGLVIVTRGEVASIMLTGKTMIEKPTLAELLDERDKGKDAMKQDGSCILQLNMGCFVPFGMSSLH